MRYRLVIGTLLVATSALSCGEDDKDPAGREGPSHSSTGALCDESISYEEFIKPFMQTYCVSCHSSQLAPAARRGAPSDANFDSEAGVLEHVEHVDELAAGGPEGIHREMPPPSETSYAAPPDELRKKLGTWIACQAQ